ncbi:hypothetical protein B0O80DRAFT_249397 [Mortierella sp. GBAus27b]|nr:hypothetical protein BGX31_002347 [Mortierella sp. GBA43]KAI8346047.1 hypothetical protein B0O80DRAFT_249397 [Mortierella sp. GBAus27b]
MQTAAAAAAQTSKRLMDTWFKGFIPGQPLAPELVKFWYSGAKEIDDMLRDKFKDDAERALSDNTFREHMKESQEGTIALTLLLDQVPRNIFRGSPRPFTEFDPLARDTVREAMAKGTCAQMHPIYRHFLFMPFEHSEDVEDHVISVREFTREYEEVEPVYKENFKRQVEFAIAHQAVIRKFGRYPHRNEILGRVPTEAERIHLETGGAKW